MRGTTDPTIALLQALADPTRLAIVRQLAQEGTVCACDLTSCCGVSQPTVSHHLKVLRAAGVVESERRGTWIHYRLRPEVGDRLRALADGLSDPHTVTRRDVGARSLPVIQPTV